MVRLSTGSFFGRGAAAFALTAGSIAGTGCGYDQPVVAPIAPVAAGGSALTGTLQDREEVLDDSWQVQRMAGANVGYLHTVITRLTGRSERYRTHVESKMEIKRGAAQLSIEIVSTTLEDAQGRFLHIHSRQKMSAEESVSDIYFEGISDSKCKGRLVSKVLGKERETPIEISADALGPYRLDQLGRSKGLEPGTSFVLRTFVPDMCTESNVSTKVIGKETVELLGGEKRELNRIETIVEIMPVPSTGWVDDDFRMWKSSMSLVGIAIEMLECDKETALAALSGAGTLSPDLFTASLLAPKEVIPFPRSLEEATIRIRPKSAEIAIPDISDSRQGIVMKEADGSVILRVKRQVPSSPGTRPLSQPPAELLPFLEANSMVQSDEPEILKIAEEVVGAEPQAWEAARQLERWVDAHISQKNFGVGFASALETCRNQSGDCSEHSVLLTALCRAAGIPARSAMGLEYIAGIWGGHAWTEVWIDGDWYALDATLGYGEVDPLHLTFSTMSLKDGAFGQEFTKMIQMLGQIELEVISAKWKGVKFRPTREEAIEHHDGRITHKLWSLAFESPQGYELEIKKPVQAMNFDLLELDGPQGDIEISAMDVPAQFTWASLSEMGHDPKAASALTIDGRSAMRLTRGKSTVVFLNAYPALFVFEFKDSDNDDGQSRVEEFLKSVDLDVGLVLQAAGM